MHNAYTNYSRFLHNMNSKKSLQQNFPFVLKIQHSSLKNTLKNFILKTSPAEFFKPLQVSLAYAQKFLFLYFVVFLRLLFLSTFTTSRIFRAHFIRYTFKRRSWPQTFELIWWIIINIDTRGFGMLWNGEGRATQINHREKDDKECKVWEEAEIIHVDYQGLHLHRRWCNSSLPISCSIYFVWCWINNRNDRRSTEEKESLQQHSFTFSLTFFPLVSF